MKIFSVEFIYIFPYYKVKTYCGKKKKHSSSLKIRNFTPFHMKKLQNIQGDSKLLSGLPWPIIFKPEITK
jgi:hypothetical protein